MHYLYQSDNESEKYIHRALSLSDKLDYKKGYIKSMCLKAVFLYYISNNDSLALRIVENAILLSQKFKIPESEAYKG